MHHRDRVLLETNLEWLRTELLQSQKLNQELHRKYQHLEGLDRRYEDYKTNLEIFYQRLKENWREDKKYYKNRVRELEIKLQNLPYLIRLMFKI